MTNLISSVFAIDVDGKPTVVFLATRWREAQELGREEWLRADLSLQTADGTPLASAASELRSRIASPDQVAKFERYRAAIGGEPNALELVYLVELDETG